MKKQIIFYVVWDVLFYLLLYVLCNAEYSLQRAYYKGGSVFITMTFPILLKMAAGGLICWLVFVTGKYERTGKSAALEFVLVGGFAFYLATIFFLYYLTPFSFAAGGSLRLAPHWMLYDTTAMTLGSILFGYELCIFIVRMVKSRKRTGPAGTEE